ncbi:MAG: hypothetical protein KGL91_06495 [Xanthomonadaceae bacterium]|nr:hypothetical protein [Xanthomonadaceae bacterium]
MKKHEPEIWIKAYDGGTDFWPPYWDRSVLRRILSRPDIGRRFDEILRDSGLEVAQEVLETCLSMRSLWEAAAKVPEKVQEKAVREIQEQTLKLLEVIETNKDALRAYRALPLSLPIMFPERPELRSPSDDEAPPLCLDDVLSRFHESLDIRSSWDGSLQVPSRPRHANAFRTYAAQNLIRLLRVRTLRPSYSIVADLVNTIIDDPNQYLDPTHVAKLDPGVED